MTQICESSPNPKEFSEINFQAVSEKSLKLNLTFRQYKNCPILILATFRIQPKFQLTIKFDRKLKILSFWKAHTAKLSINSLKFRRLERWTPIIIYRKNRNIVPKFLLGNYDSFSLIFAFILAAFLCWCLVGRGPHDVSSFY